MPVDAVAADSADVVDLAGAEARSPSGSAVGAASGEPEPERLGASAPRAGSQEPERLGASAPRAGSQEPERLGRGTDEAPAWSAAGDTDAAWSPEPAGGWGGSDDFGGTSTTADEHGADSLDDDAFFASLRDAVRDDEPLGPATSDGFYDEDDEGGKKLFRRRR